ncbi:cytochrome P450 [Nocardioides marmoriginsengisoli]|uniref:Cytochrome P450 n=1 Tax=Nocardioides marmoriginsengisoli TaxID=661483 RepID=A0A3N0CGM3_9ACTN|nr:cytochrome P450 [Nocardioides marmoriginsengisoli]RNL62610.1 cytochrome P450 [Nocardioides marmoriginsengisoli]
MSLLSSFKSAVMKRIVARTGGVDFTKLDKIPDSLAWPLIRDGVDPTDRLLAAQAQDPVQKLTSFMGLELWLITGYDEAREVLGNVNHSTDIRPYMGKSGDVEKGDIGGLGFTDPPEHTRQRKLLTPEFTMRRLARLKPAIADIIDKQLDETAAGAEAGDGVVDLVQTFAFPVPFRVICDLLGLPDEQRETFRKLGAARFDMSEGGAGSIGSIGASREFLLAETARQRHDPGPGLIGQIIRDSGDQINDFDLGGLADGAFNGGMETSASMLALGTVLLLQNPELWKSLAEDPDSVDDIVEELLRQLAVVQIAFPRFAKEDVVVGGHKIKKGSIMLAHLPTASRDPRSTPGAGLCPMKESSNHLAFGHGLHRCVGAELARMELRAAYPALAKRFPNMRLAVDPSELQYHAKSIVYGLEALPVRLS